MTLDYRKLAEDELRAVRQLRAAEAICRDRLAELGDELRSFRTPSPQTEPVRGGGSKTEERWLSIIAAQQDEERRLRNVRRRLKRFNTAWAVLAERDRTVLADWYIEPGGDPADRITRREGCSRRTAFR
ncbi:hypothetical protein SDC9_101663 [bioreactor metagenome]|uniref:Uncharacterized protein n=1 Tax=bioreactor metagenome TaxID=1076179 RepID=A0A645AP57_9ZZZZ